MAKAKLTKKTVEAFTCRPGRDQDVLWCTEVKGFGMRLSMKSNTRAYFIQFRVKGANKERSITIGRHGDPWTPELARNRALELKVQMLGDGVTGVDPVAEAAAQRVEAERNAQAAKAAATTLRQVMTSYFTHRKLRPATEKDMRRHCEKNLSAWLDRPVVETTRSECLEVFTTLSARAPGQANLCMTYWRSLLNHARDMSEDKHGNPTMLAVNPITRMWKIAKPNPEEPRDTRIPLPKVGVCWNDLVRRSTHGRSENERTAADWCRFILLTGTRRGESQKLEWRDVNFEARTVTFRKETTKTARELVLPMSDALHDLLKARQDAVVPESAQRHRIVQRNVAFVFATNGRKTPYITNAHATLKALTGLAGAPVHLHALRRTTDDIGKEAGVPDDVGRMLLNHASGDVHARHYANNRAFLVSAVQKIAEWIAQQGLVAAGGNVIQFPSKNNQNTPY